MTSLSFTLGLLAFACDATDESNGPIPVEEAGSDATQSSDALDNVDGPTSVAGLCGKVGGVTKVNAISDAIYDNAAADCRIGVYFAALSADDVLHTKQCMRNQLAEIFSCGTTYASSKDEKGVACRNMIDAHAGLRGATGDNRLNQNDYLAYVQATQSALKTNGVSDEDAASVITIFNQFRSSVAPATVSDTSNADCKCTDSQAATCIPDGGYVKSKPDAGSDAKAPVDSGVKDTGKPDTAVPDSGPPDAGATMDASDGGG